MQKTARCGILSPEKGGDHKMEVKKLLSLLEQDPVIAAIGNDKWDDALQFPGKVIFYLSADLLTLEEKIKSVGNIRAISDHTDKYYDYEQLMKDYEGCLLQRYISSFGQSEEEIDKKALAYGTEAILEALKA